MTGRQYHNDTNDFFFVKNGHQAPAPGDQGTLAKGLRRPRCGTYHSKFNDEKSKQSCPFAPLAQAVQTAQSTRDPQAQAGRTTA
jgi:hypothetical protein